MAAVATHPAYSLAQSDFDLCAVRCRTSSGSTVHENTYRSRWMHCFGALNPPLVVSSAFDRQHRSVAAAAHLAGRQGSIPNVPPDAVDPVVSRDTYLPLGAPFWPPEDLPLVGPLEREHHEGGAEE